MSDWRDVLAQLCDSTRLPIRQPACARSATDCARCTADQIESQADALLAARGHGNRRRSGALHDGARCRCIGSISRAGWPSKMSSGVDAPGVCPICGVLPVASVVRADSRSQGYRYLHCALCATEWHMVRVTCSHCQSTKGITYQSIEGGSGRHPRRVLRQLPDLSQDSLSGKGHGRRARGGRSREPCARPAAERSGLSSRQRQSAAVAGQRVAHRRTWNGGVDRLGREQEQPAPDAVDPTEQLSELHS